MRAPSAIAAILLFGSSLAYSQTALTASPTSLSFTFAQGGASPPVKTITLTSTPAVAFTITFATTSGGGWLQVNPLTGSTTATLHVQLDPFSANLGPGVYNGVITVNQTLKIPVTLNIITALLPSSTSLTFSAQQGAPAPPV
jgi:hypothetical protein